jgi:hypothetical protein
VSNYLRLSEFNNSLGSNRALPCFWRILCDHCRRWIGFLSWRGQSRNGGLAHRSTILWLLGLVLAFTFNSILKLDFPPIKLVLLLFQLLIFNAFGRSWNS